MTASFRLLLVWVDGHETYASAEVARDFTEAEMEALERAAARPGDAFLLVAQRNWQYEVVTRKVRVPAEVRRLFSLPDGEAVDRLIGWEDADGQWQWGLAGLEPVKAKVLRYRVVERWATWEICRELHLRPASVRVYLREARLKLREHLSGQPAAGDGNVSASGPTVSAGLLAGAVT